MNDPRDPIDPPEGPRLRVVGGHEPGDPGESFFADGPEPADEPEPQGVTHHRTDLGNAERLIEWYGDDLRFVATWGKWLAWDGRRWALDDVGRAHRCAKQTARRLLSIALTAQRQATQALARATAAGDEKEKERAESALEAARADVTHAVRSQSSSRLHAMLDVARSDAAIVVSHVELDADPMLLNVSNGTLDLRTGALRPHIRADLCTKLAPVEYDARATAPIFDAFLSRAMGGNAELVAFLQRVTGYALTGDVSEHVLVFSHGDGANGKSTYHGTIHTMLGDYATPAPRGLLFRSRGERHPTELASLHGRRFVTCSEIEEGQTFDEALTKDLTGGDPIECRRMREDFWSFEPTHKLFLSGNHKPSVRGDDEGIWRRMRLMPWAIVIPEGERDTELPAKLRAELPGILRWAVEGCMAWRASGLNAPSAVREATRGYREENDLLGQFFRLHVVFATESTIPRRELRDAYERFCSEGGSEPYGAKRFGARLREHGVTETSARGEPRMVNSQLVRPVVNAWRGVRLATDTERASATDSACRQNETAEKQPLGTCSDQFPVSAPTPSRYDGLNPDHVATSTYVPTTDAQPDSNTFDDYLDRESVR